MYAIGQYLILKFIMRKSKDIQSRKKLHLDKIHTIVAIAQFAITAVLVLVILQMITMYSYNNGMIITCTTISYVLAIILMSILAKQLFSWYKSNRNLVIILYAISSTIIAVNAGLTLIFVDIILMHQPTEVPTSFRFCFSYCYSFFNICFIK